MLPLSLAYNFMQSHTRNFTFDQTYNFGTETLIVYPPNYMSTSVIPPVTENFLLLDGTDFLLLDGTNFLLL